MHWEVSEPAYVPTKSFSCAFPVSLVLCKLALLDSAYAKDGVNLLPEMPHIFVSLTFPNTYISMALDSGVRNSRFTTILEIYLLHHF